MNLIQSLSNVTEKILEFFAFINGILFEIDFSVLWSWIPLPSDIAAVLFALMFVILILAGVGFVKKIIVLLG